MNKALRLVDLGERRIISEVLAPRYESALRFGDDCANVPLPSGDAGILIATTDPCPPPMAHELGFDDPYYSGWLLATINLSDLAAAGAEPLGLLTSLVLPADTTVANLERLLDGVDACCAQVGTGVVGGNLKEAPRRDFAATALGICRVGPPLSRRGARVGDAVVVLGDLGSFWAGVLGMRNGAISASDASHPLLRNVLTPLPKVHMGRACREAGLLRCAMDNSDGLYPTLAQLAEANEARIHIRGDQIEFDHSVATIAAHLDIDPVRLALGFGDWQLIGSCTQESLDRLQELGEAQDVPVTVIGEVMDGEGVTIERGGEVGNCLPLDSERFTTGSWFTSGLDGYIEILRNERLVQPGPS